jgi:hypothetical protein
LLFLVFHQPLDGGRDSLIVMLCGHAIILSPAVHLTTRFLR